MKTIIYLLLLILLLSSCAGQYGGIYPDKITYANNSEDLNIDFAYRYDVLFSQGYKRYAKKESKKGIRLVAVKLKNETDRNLTFGEDVDLYVGSQPVLLMENKGIYKSLRQNSYALYLLYLLLTPTRLTITLNGRIESYPIGLAVGPGLAVGNMGTAVISNKRLKRELEKENLLGRVIPPGETVYGLVGLRTKNFDPLSVKLVK